MNKNQWLIFPILTGLLALGVPTHADVISTPPDTGSCAGKQAGFACKTDKGQSGVCEVRTCSYTGYRSRNPNDVVEHDCLKCVEGNGDNRWNSGGSGGGNSSATGAGSIAKAVGPWFLAGLFSLLFIKRRRRSKPD